MNEKFLNLDQVKQYRIINAAIKEFALKGYDQASTNEIVKEAEISKGLLFHYFNSKKDLYLFLYDYFIDKFLQEFYAKLDPSECDFLEKYRQVVLLKFDLFQKHPDMFQFIYAAYSEESSNIQTELAKRNKEIIANAYAQFFTNIDISVFKDGTDVKRMMDIIKWTMDGFSQQYQDKTKNMLLNQINWNEVLKDLDEYIQILKDSFYK